MPLDPSIVNSFPTITGTGSHITVTRTIVIDTALIAPPLEDLIAYAKTRSLPLDDLYDFSLKRYQTMLGFYINLLEARLKILEAYNSSNDIFQKLQAAFKDAQKRKDLEQQKSLSEKLVSVGQSLVSITSKLAPVDESIKNADVRVKYWENILALLGHPVKNP
jgi:hypothetical protein